ncbi:MAG: helix-turn-helix domain-containing protein [Caulobacter sp.]
MALDSGGVWSLYRTGEIDVSEPTRLGAPELSEGLDIGVALKAIREHHGVTLQDLSDATRIRQTYLAALEDMRLDDLPSRPFAIGYVKAYARHFGLDQDEAVERFKTEAPDHDAALRAPVGVRKQRDPRLGLILTVGVLATAAFVLWNVAQRSINAEKPAPTVAQQAALPPVAGPQGPLEVGEPLPPPPEATVPIPYETPGLEAAAASGGSADAVEAAARARNAAEAGQPVMPELAVGTPFRQRGEIHGAPPAQASPVLVQARRGSVLVVKGADDTIYFSGVLRPGEAYRVPSVPGLKLEVPDPQAFNVYVGGAFKGYLPAPVSNAAKLAE